MRSSTIAPNISEAAWPADVESLESELPGAPEEPAASGLHAWPTDELLAGFATVAAGEPFRIGNLSMEGRLFVTEEADSGDVHVRVLIEGREGASALQLEADVREGWLRAACGEAEGETARAVAIVHALTRIMELPNQHTVRVQATVF